MSNSTGLDRTVRRRVAIEAHDRGIASGDPRQPRLFGQHDGGATGRFRAGHDAPRHSPAHRRIELLPYRFAARADYILDAGRADAGQDLQMAAPPRSPRARDLALGVECLLRAHRVWAS